MSDTGAEGLVERLRHADQHSQQRCLGSRIFGEAADALEANARALAEAEDAITGERWHADEAARQRDEWQHRAEDAERQRDEALEALRAMEAALQKPFSVLFLDGRNEHGTHVLPSLPTNLPPDFESDMGDQAEAIMVEAERLGFTPGEDDVWSVWRWNAPQYGDYCRVEFDGYWEFVGIDVPMSEWLRARSVMENSKAGLADANSKENAALSSGAPSEIATQQQPGWGSVRDTALPEDMPAVASVNSGEEA